MLNYICYIYVIYIELADKKMTQILVLVIWQLNSMYNWYGIFGLECHVDDMRLDFVECNIYSC